VREIVAATGFFSAEEVRIAEELVEERLSRGEDSGYLFLFADRGGDTVGYTCYGLIPLTAASYDLYWIAVHPSAQGDGLGRRLLTATEKRIRALGGRRVYAETSSRPQYLPTRAFYDRCGYRTAAQLEDFYAPGDGKVIFEKVLRGGARPTPPTHRGRRQRSSSR
jgi:GNAT superfamily N-acetyltransferase